MSNANVVRKLEDLAPDASVKECLRDLFLYELRIADKAAPQFKEQYKTVLKRSAASIKADGGEE